MREAALKAEPAGPAEAARVERTLALRRLLAVGPETSTVLGNEVFFRRFENRRQLAAYVGLAPSPHMSGGLSREQGIAKSGNPRARTALVELAWLWLRHQPGSARSALVRAPGRRAAWAAAADHGGRPGAEASRRFVALPRDWPGAAGSDPAG